MHNYLFALLLAVALLAYGCSGPEPAAPSSSEKPLWMTAELTDVNTGTAFSIGQFDKPVLMESFAVWCPVCTRQQQESRKLEESFDNVVSISLDTDPNEDAQMVREHARSNGFGWRYAIAPADVTSSLVDDFGISITNVPLAPMIVVCPDGSAHRLRNGVKAASELESSITQLCG